jgi:hypothetical protein
MKTTRSLKNISHKLFTSLCLSLCAAASAQNASPSANTVEVDPLPRDLEFDLALSALPESLRHQAMVYVLNPHSGFVVAQKGTNGFHALVARTGDDAMRGQWHLDRYPKDVLYPLSFDSAGAKANMRVFFDIAEAQAKGVPPQDLKEKIQKRYRDAYYAAPERAGCSYMLSPILRTYVNPDEADTIVTASVPHVMCYAPNVTTQDVGVNPTPDQIKDFMSSGHWRTTPEPFVIHSGPHGYMVHIRGTADQKAIIEGNAELLRKLCNLNKAWCLPAPLMP